MMFKLIQEGEKSSPEEKKRQEEAIRAVVRYCQNDVDCRRVQVLNFFGQKFNAQNCGRQCDVCMLSLPVVQEDMTNHAKSAIRLAQTLLARDRLTKAHCMNVFKGSKIKEVKDKGHDNLPLFGVGQQLDRDKVERLFDHLLGEQAFREQSVQNAQGWNSMYMQVRSRPPTLVILTSLGTAMIRSVLLLMNFSSTIGSSS